MVIEFLAISFRGKKVFKKVTRKTSYGKHSLANDCLLINPIWTAEISFYFLPTAPY